MKNNSFENNIINVFKPMTTWHVNKSNYLHCTHGFIDNVFVHKTQCFC